MEIDARAKNRVEDLRNALANSLNSIEGSLELFKFECQFNKWNDDIVMQIEDGCLQLGFALATLTNWWKEPNENESEDELKAD